MRKHLLLMAGACIGISASAAEPAIIPDILFEAVSPNGEWASGSDPMTYDFLIYNIPEGKSYVLPASEDGSSTYSAGSGNFLSNTGVVAIDITDIGPAAVWDNGEVEELPISLEHRSSHANGITPDATRICGNIGLVDFSLDDVIMQTPVLWTRNDDGKWNECVELPYPKVDFTGRVPQYVLAIAISENGKTVAGQIRDYSGFIMQPILWQEDENGEWNYSLPNADLINPDGIEFPEWPGEAPEWVEATSYMTPEEAEAYQAALLEYYTTWENQPDPTDYMTEEKAAAYTAAVEAYKEAYEQWEIDYFAYTDLLYEVQESAVLFPMNNVYLSSNGRYYASSHYYHNFFLGITEEYPVVLDLETGNAYLKKSDVPLLTSYINDNGTVIASQTLQSMSMIRNAWICPTLEDEFITLSEYVQPKFPSIYTWMEENMSHDLESYDPETFDPVILPNVWQTGTAYADDDLTTIVSSAQNTWDYESDSYFFSYIIPLDYGSSSALDAKTKTFGISATKNGKVRINGAAAHLEVYDMNGRMVFSIDNPSGEVATGLRSGLYVIKATGKDGNVVTSKASI